MRKWGVIDCLALERKDKNCCLVGNLLDLGSMKLLYRELGATLGAATLDDEATLVIGHADAEAVGIAALDFFGLISAFHNFDILTGGR